MKLSKLVKNNWEVLVLIAVIVGISFAMFQTQRGGGEAETLISQQEIKSMEYDEDSGEIEGKIRFVIEGPHMMDLSYDFSEEEIDQYFGEDVEDVEMREKVEVQM